MLAAFLKAVKQLGDPAIRRVLWISLGLSLLVFLLLWTGVGYLLSRTSFFQIGWIDTAVDVLGGFATLALSWLLFPAVMLATAAGVGLLTERVTLSLDGRRSGFYRDRSGALVAFHATPGYETYKGLGWFGVIRAAAG